MASGKYIFWRVCLVSILLSFFFSCYGVGLSLTYDNASGDGDWNNPANWTTGTLPDSSDDAILTASVFANSGAPAHVDELSVTDKAKIDIVITVDAEATFSGSSSIWSGTIIGDTTFSETTFNDGNVSGIATFNDSSINYGSVTGDAYFNVSNINQGNISGNAVFRNSSSNSASGTISGNTEFYDTSYNAGTVVGDARFYMYSAATNRVTVSGNIDFHGTGNVQGVVYDALLSPVTHWHLTNTSRLTGFLKGDMTLVDNSQNFNTVSGDVTFLDASDNSGGIVLGNAIFRNTSYNGGIVMGNAHFYDASENQWAINGNATFMIYTGTSGIVTISSDNSFLGTGSIGWVIFDSLGSQVISWDFHNGSVLNGILKGNAFFYDTSINNGIVFGTGTFYDTSTNNGTINGDGYFSGTATDGIGTVITWTKNLLPIQNSSNGGGGGGGWSTIVFPPVVTPSIPAILPVIPASTDTTNDETNITPTITITPEIIEEDALISFDEPVDPTPIPPAVTSTTPPKPRRVAYVPVKKNPSISANETPQEIVMVTSRYPEYISVCQLLVGTDALNIFLNKGICDVLHVTHPLVNNQNLAASDMGGGVIPESSSQMPLILFFIAFLMLNLSWFAVLKKKHS